MKTVMRGVRRSRGRNGKRAIAAATAFIALGRPDFAQAADTLTQRSDNGRTGRVVDAAIGNTSFANGQWQKLGALLVDGVVYAQPLFKQGALVNGATHDVLVVATANNTVYAFDANTGAQLWAQHLGPPDLSEPNVGSTPCTQMSPVTVDPVGNATSYGIGIQSTPVIDSSGNIYVAYRTGTTAVSAAQQWLAKISLANGTFTRHEISISELDGSVSLGISAVRQRASLLLLNGIVYVGFGSRCEDRAVDEPASGFVFRGVLLAYDSTLRRVGRFFTTPPPSQSGRLAGGGIWQASTGPAADTNGNIYFTTGNALIRHDNTTTDSATPAGDYVPNSFVRLKPSFTGSGATLQVHFSDAFNVANDQANGWYTPARSEWHNRADLDLGSAGVILPPNTNAVVGGGKEGVMYVLDRSNLDRYPNGHMTVSDLQPCYTTLADTVQTCTSCYTSDAADPHSSVQPTNGQKFQAASNMDCPTCNMGNWIGWPHIHGTPVYGTASDGSDYLYLWPEKDRIKAFKRDATKPYLAFDTTQTAVGVATTPNGGMPGGMLTLSAGTKSSILFGATPTVNLPGAPQVGALAAFDATPLDGAVTQLWGDYPNDAHPYMNAKFAPPTVANGKVFLPTFSQKVLIYGQTSPAPPVQLKSYIAAMRLGGTTNRVVGMVAEQAGTLAVFAANNSDASDWGNSRIATLGAANDFPIGAPIALDVHGTDLAAVTVDKQGRLRLYWTSFLGNATSWQGVTLTAANAATPGAKVATGHRGSGNSEFDIFFVDPGGDIHGYATTGALSQSSAWFNAKLAQPSTKFPPGGGIATGVQNGTQLDVFAVDDSHMVRNYASSLNPPGGWLIFTLPGTTLPKGAHLATGHRGTNELDVFGIAGSPTGMPSASCLASDANDNGCLKRMSVSGTGSWSTTSIPRFFVGWTAPGVPGSPVTVTQQSSNQLDVLFVSQTGVVVVYASTGTGGFPVFPTTIRAQPGSPLVGLPAAYDGSGAQTRTYVLLSGTRHINPSTAPEGPTMQGVNGVFGATANGTSGTWSNPWRAF